ncbi:MAG: serine/threonine protein kinase [Gemmataceae bacterium]|nr:serine/threonine protein kinase [Gemmataceae bacterium]
MSPDPGADDDPTDDLAADAAELADVLRTPPPLASQAAVAGVLARLETRPSNAGFDRFQLVRELGSGGMGVVYLAHHLDLGGPVAVKVIHPHLAGDKEFRDRFKKEVQALSRVRSTDGVEKDNVVTVHDARTSGARFYLVMELLKGATLEDWLRCRPLPSPAADLNWVAEEVLTGLIAIHRAGIIHTDVKPQNLWVERDTGRVKVLDFGVHRPAVAGKPGGAGTPAYMAPEQKRYEEVNARADLFAVGAVLYRMVAGPPPDSGPVLDHPALNALPPELADFIRKFLDPETDHRPANAKAALEELEKAREQADRAEDDRRAAAAKVAELQRVADRAVKAEADCQKAEAGCQATAAAVIALLPIAAQAVEAGEDRTRAEADRRLWICVTASLATCLGIVAAGWALDRLAADRRAAEREAAAERAVAERDAVLGRIRAADQNVDEARAALGRVFKEVDDKARELAQTPEQPEAVRRKVQGEYNRAFSESRTALDQVWQALADRTALLDQLAATAPR